VVREQRSARLGLVGHAPRRAGGVTAPSRYRLSLAIPRPALARLLRALA
jgi:hypothetical protein